MVSVYDWYIMGSLVVTLVAYFLIVWFDKDNRPTKKAVFKSWKEIK
jgi:hypothetical protein